MPAVAEKTAPKAASKLKGRDPETVKPGKAKLMVFSKSGIGKSWFSMDFPKPFYIDCEGGARLAHYQAKLKAAGGWYFGVEDGALDFPTVLEQIQVLATEKHPYQTLAIGSITKLFQTAIAHESQRIEDSGKKDEFGASKKPAVRQMRRLISWIARLDMNVLFEAHEAAEWGINPATGQREEIGQIPDVYDKLIYELDLTLRLEKRGNSRVAVVRKSRLSGFPELSNFPLEYQEFATRYGKDFIEGAVSQIVLASPDQVAEIKKIMDFVKVDEREIEKLMTKANADTWEELTTEQAAATIIWLKKKVNA